MLHTARGCVGELFDFLNGGTHVLTGGLKFGVGKSVWYPKFLILKCAYLESKI